MGELRISSEELWDTVSRVNDLLIDAQPLDTAHIIQCHAEDVPQTLLQLSKAVEEAISLLQQCIHKQVGG